MGTFTRRPVYPPTCFHAAILGHNSGSGGSNHAQVNCKECNKLGTVCLWAKFHPDVHTGYGNRDDNGVVPSGEDRRYKPDAEPRTINFAGQEIRWILKRRKETPAAPDETAWDLGGKVV
ncbi:hypothetical protein G647_02065 [Cladophialophora carrionii CBS 160.54]|uniref:Uncharacterized protein n=1 Tax=Cladophialophora carrionii CBS 160.54 TaxID=1279043 RepID=V9DUB4_9EURO|nr:uncharacterized protein G647_02065 [Cladophialophora carrionii CBS 160.54]ETI29612.1 hypothetical protein G647_02065 [Cladophialophora carrionii CBS 160.54]